jgi:hypothetical protein
MTRHWEPGAGWVREPVARLCRTCGAALPPMVGTGRPRLYCEAHAPSRHLYVATWQRDHADHVRDYQRRHFGYRPLLEFTCGICGQPARSYLSTTTCSPCRSLRHSEETRP